MNTVNKRIEEISKATIYIEDRLDQVLSIAGIAQAVGLSVFHFQRLFFASLGESVSDYIRRRRLERGAKLLLDSPGLTIIEVSLEAGFESHSAFSRAFKDHFGQSPSAFRKVVQKPVDVTGADNRPFLLPIRQKQPDLVADLVDLPELWLMYREQKGVVNGSYFPESERLLSEFAELMALGESGFWSTCGSYRGGPSAFSDDSAIGCYGALFEQKPSTAWSELFEVLPPGRWAVVPHYGEFDYLHLTWNKAVRNWLPGSGLQLRQSWAFETYLKAPGQIQAREASAQIYLPVR